jgi:hypothetical protein
MVAWHGSGLYGCHVASMNTAADGPANAALLCLIVVLLGDGIEGTWAAYLRHSAALLLRKELLVWEVLQHFVG